MITGGHYIGDLGYDRWTAAYGATYTTDSNGVANVSLSLPHFTLGERNPVAGRTLVVHLSSNYGSKRVMCGIIEPSYSEMTVIGDYPGQTYGVKGMVLAHPASFGLYFEGLLAGLIANENGGWHVHGGYGACATPDGVDGEGNAHYYTAPDPWLVTTYQASATGAAWISQPMGNFSLYS